jgi:ABC-type uncharacterized transport system substrate-binding protein
MKNFIIPLLLVSFLIGCESKKSDVPTVAFIDAFQDNTIAKAREGFFAALAENGFDDVVSDIWGDETSFQNCDDNLEELPSEVFNESEMARLFPNN